MNPRGRLTLWLALVLGLGLMLSQLNWEAQHGPDAAWPLRLLAAPALVWLLVMLAFRRQGWGGPGWRERRWALAACANFLLYLALANLLLALFWGELDLDDGLVLGGASLVMPVLMLAGVVWAQFQLTHWDGMPPRRLHGVVALRFLGGLGPRLTAWMEEHLGQPLAHGLTDLATLWLPLRLALLLVMFLAARLILPGLELPPKVPAPPQDWLGFLMRWDAYWYQDVAQNLYASKAAKHAFFPMYPLLVRWVAELGGLTARAAGILVANLCSLSSVLVLYLAYHRALGRRALSAALVFLAVWPASYFMASMYTESTYLLVTLLSFWAFRKERLALCGLAGALAAATRPTGIVLLPAFLLARVWERRRLAWGDLWLLLIAGGVGGYALYCWQVTGDPLVFHHVQAHWQRELVMPWVAGVEALQNLAQALELENARSLATVVDGAALITSLALLGVIWREVGKAEALFLLATLALALTTGSTLSLTRFVASAFPLFLALGILTASRPRLLLVLAAGLAMLAAYFGICFTLWIWTW